MNTRKHFSVLSAALAALCLLTALAGCGQSANAPAASTPAAAQQPVSSAAPAGESLASAEVVVAADTAESSAAEIITDTPERQNGERFEDIIILEGMQETVHYEHVRNDALGFEMDYDYEQFVRRTEPDRECFVSVWDDPNSPENYLEVKSSPLDAETAAAAIGETLSQTYEIRRNDAFPLARAGQCIRIDASADVGGLTMPDQLQMVYILPASDGCRIATAHYAIEASEGFGRRFHYLMDTFSVLPCSGSTGQLTGDQAVAAVRNYCLRSIPGLQEIVNSGEYPVYWDLSSSSENEIVVLFRSSTGALVRYYIDPASGDAYVTEQVPGIMDQEQRTGETLNLRDYLS